jgi:hypothetical protein
MKVTILNVLLMSFVCLQLRKVLLFPNIGTYFICLSTYVCMYICTELHRKTDMKVQILDMGRF